MERLKPTSDPSCESLGGSAAMGTALVMLLLPTATPVVAQDYRIEFEHMARLTSGENTPCMVEHELTYGVRDSRGRFVIYSTDADRLTVFASNGRCLHEVGRRGSGPGEYQEVVSVNLQGDSLVVYDLRANRVTVLDPEFEATRTYRPERLLGMRIRVAPGGELVVNQRLRTPDAAGFPLHRFGPDGKYLGSFGGAPDRYAEGTAETSRMFYVGEEVWEAWPRQWVFRVWSLDGEHLRTLRPEPPAWFPPPEVEFDYSLQSPPRPTIAGIWVDMEDRMWVVTTVAGNDWQGGVSEEDGRRRLADRTRFYGTAVHALDARSGNILAGDRLDAFVTMVEPGMLGLVEYDSRPELVYTVVRPRLIPN